MIDIHSHILPGLDDGAQDLAESIAMARMAQADGVKEIIATPHNANWMGSRREEVLSLAKDLQAELEAKGIDVRIVPGVEVYLVPELARQLATGQAFTLDETRYLLLELPLSAYPVYTEQVIFELQVRGIVPVLAHPERNVAFQENVNLLFPLVERGALAQLTAASLEGIFGPLAQETARIMLEHKLAHFIASDAHGLINRTPVLSKGVEEAAKVIGPEGARAMVEGRPAALLRDEEITTEPPVKYVPKHRWFWQR
ncbi:MAG: tyrosine-protein phosphatase [Anaerolineae bacterium]